jgi:hypothetical protein
MRRGPVRYDKMAHGGGGELPPDEAVSVEGPRLEPAVAGPVR